MISRRALLGAGSAALSLSALRTGSVFADGGAPWDRLRSHLHGTLVLPSDGAYATAKQLDLMQFDHISPQAVAYCVCAADVALCLAFAQDHSLPVAARSGGHSLGGYSTTPGLVIDVSRLDSITLGEGTATLGPGAQNVDILNALAPSGLAVTGGAGPTVAAGGFIQGGGLGFLTRSLGMACDKLTSAEVVLANGRVVTASPSEHTGLYWAIRGGGGGNFGIVTSYTVTPSPVTTVATATLVFGYDRALDMLDGYARWLVDAPRTIGGAAVVTLANAVEGAVPVPVIRLVSTGTGVELENELGRLLALTGPPLSRSTAALPYQSLMMGVYGCATRTAQECHRVGSTSWGQLPRPAFGLERSRMFPAPMPRSGWAGALAVFDTERAAGRTHQLQVLPLGGAAADLGRTETAYVHRDSLYTTNYLVSIQGPSASDADKAGGRRWVDGGFAAIDPYSGGETYQNFIDPALQDWKRSYYAENYPRLAAVKAAYDPYRVFRFAQGVR